MGYYYGVHCLNGVQWKLIWLIDSSVWKLSNYSRPLPTTNKQKSSSSYRFIQILSKVNSYYISLLERFSALQSKVIFFSIISSLSLSIFILFLFVDLVVGGFCLFLLCSCVSTTCRIKSYLLSKRSGLFLFYFVMYLFWNQVIWTLHFQISPGRQYLVTRTAKWNSTYSIALLKNNLERSSFFSWCSV